MAAKKLVSMRLSEEADDLLTELAEDSGVTESEILAQAIKDIYAKRQEEKRLKALDNLAAATFLKFLLDNPLPGWEWLWLESLNDEIENFSPAINKLIDRALSFISGFKNPDETDDPESIAWLRANLTESVNIKMTEAVIKMAQEYIQQLCEVNFTDN